MPPSRESSSSHRQGSLTLELLVLMPVLLFFLLLVLEMCLLATASQRLNVASFQGARAAAQHAPANDVAAIVKQSLSPRLRGVHVSTQLGVHTGDPVVVTITLPAERAVPDVLRVIGFSLQGQTLTGQTVLRRE